MTEIKIEKNEFWWGGTTMHGYCPLNARSDYHQDFRKYAPNQTMPFFVSSLGRYIWSEEPFKIDIENGKIIIDGENIILEKAGSTLKEAYLEAQKKHFSCDGVKLEKKFFEIPQYNSWIEFTYYPTQNGILEYAHNIIKNGFEPGVLIIDEGWHINTGYGNWEFDFARFPDPKAMVDELHSLGFVVMLWITPFVSPVGPGYVRSLNAFIGTDPESANHIYKRNENNEIAMTKWWNGISAILDLTNKYDADFLDKQLQHLIIDYGVDGFKFDGGALHHYSDDNIINGSFAKGHSPAECNIAWNEFGRKYRYHEYKDTFKGGGKNVIQRLHDRDHSWTGNGLSDIIPCAITNGLIGHPFICPDMVGGGEWRNRYTPGFITDEELFVRMAQCSALFPMIQFSWAPWEALSEENLRICVEAARLHSSMSKEILALVESAEETGEPIIRCLEYNDPMQGYEEINDEFMLGEDILVAPVMEKGAEERTVVFPEGMWQDTDGKIYEGRNSFAVSAPLNKLPWFRRINKE